MMDNLVIYSYDTENDIDEKLSLYFTIFFHGFYRRLGIGVYRRSKIK